MLKVDEIQNGVVIDHITAGTGLALYHMMELEKLTNASVALLQNVRSQKDGKKDIIKIEGDVSEMSFDVLAYVDPKISITFIKDGALQHTDTLAGFIAHYSQGGAPRTLEDIIVSVERRGLDESAII